MKQTPVKKRPRPGSLPDKRTNVPPTVSRSHTSRNECNIVRGNCNCKKAEASVIRHFKPNPNRKTCGSIPEVQISGYGDDFTNQGSKCLQLHPVFKLVDNLFSSASASQKSVQKRSVMPRTANPKQKPVSKLSSLPPKSKPMQIKVAKPPTNVHEKVRTNLRNIAGNNSLRVSLKDECVKFHEPVKMPSPPNPDVKRDQYVTGLKEEIASNRPKCVEDARNIINQLRNEILNYRLNVKNTYSCSCTELYKYTRGISPPPVYYPSFDSRHRRDKPAGSAEKNSPERDVPERGMLEKFLGVSQKADGTRVGPVQTLWRSKASLASSSEAEIPPVDSHFDHKLEEAHSLIEKVRQALHDIKKEMHQKPAEEKARKSSINKSKSSPGSDERIIEETEGVDIESLPLPPTPSPTPVKCVIIEKAKEVKIQETVVETPLTQSMIILQNKLNTISDLSLESSGTRVVVNKVDRSCSPFCATPKSPKSSDDVPCSPKSQGSCHTPNLPQRDRFCSPLCVTPKSPRSSDNVPCSPRSQDSCHTARLPQSPPSPCCRSPRHSHSSSPPSCYTPRLAQSPNSPRPVSSCKHPDVQTLLNVTCIHKTPRTPPSSSEQVSIATPCKHMSSRTICKCGSTKSSAKSIAVKEEKAALSIQLMPPINIRSGLVMQRTLNLCIKPTGSGTNEIIEPCSNVGYREIASGSEPQVRSAETQVEPQETPLEPQDETASRRFVNFGNEKMTRDQVMILKSFQVMGDRTRSGSLASSSGTPDRSDKRNPWEFGFYASKATQWDDVAGESHVVVPRTASERSSLVDEEIPEKDTAQTVLPVREASLTSIKTPSMNSGEPKDVEEENDESSSSSSSESEDSKSQVEPVDNSPESGSILSVETAEKKADYSFSIDAASEGSQQLVKASIPAGQPPTIAEDNEELEKNLNLKPKRDLDIAAQLRNARQEDAVSEPADVEEDESEASESLQPQGNNQKKIKVERIGNISRNSIAVQQKQDETIQVSLSSSSADSNDSDGSNNSDSSLRFKQQRRPTTNMASFITGLTGKSSYEYFHSTTEKTIQESKSTDDANRREIEEETEVASVAESELSDLSEHAKMERVKLFQQYVKGDIKPKKSGSSGDKDNSKVVMRAEENPVPYYRMNAPFYRRLLDRMAPSKNPIRSVNVSPSEPSASEGEVTDWRRSVSIGEVRPFGKEGKKAKHIKKHPEKAIRKELGDKSLQIARQRTQYNNWVTYYVQKNKGGAVNDSSPSTSFSKD